jgi:adenosylmethionine-8-amino-7-oxononanoate aminotransferase
MEACLKLCRQYWVEKGEPQRKYIIARFPSYHGNTLGALAVSRRGAARRSAVHLCGALPLKRLVTNWSPIIDPGRDSRGSETSTSAGDSSERR